MEISGASDFLAAFGARFANTEVASWLWEQADDQFGKRATWAVSGDSSLETYASVELTGDALQLTVTEKDVSGDLDERQVEPSVVFSGSISFDDGVVTHNNEPLDYTVSTIEYLVDQFNERS